MGVGVYATSQKSFFPQKMDWVLGFQTPSEDSLELRLSQTGLAKMRNYIKQPQVKK